MNEVSFNEEPHYARRTTANATAKQGSIIGLMYKLGVAKTEKDANVVLGGIIAVCFIVTATMFAFVQPHQDAAHAEALKKDVERFQKMNGAVVPKSQ